MQRFGFSSSASPEADEKDAAKKSESASSNASEQDEVSDKKKSTASDQEEESGSVSVALFICLSALSNLNSNK